MAFNERFDINEAREEARQAQFAKRNKMIISYSILAVVIIVLIIGGKIGWDFWQEKRAEAAEEARMAEQREKERERKERARQLKEREEREAKKEAERKAREEERERKRAEREAQREAERKAREEERAARQAEKDALKAAAAERKELAEYATSLLQGLELKLEDHIAVEDAIKRQFEFSSSDPKWEKLMSGWRSRNAVVFFDAIPLGGYTVQNNELPSRQVMTAKLDALATETYTMDVKVTVDEKKAVKSSVYSVDAEKGLVEIDDSKTVKDGKRIVGWHVDFVYGEGKQSYLMSERKAKRLQDEFEEELRKIRREARRSHLSADTVASMNARAAADFAQRVRLQISTPEPEKVDDPAAATEAKKSASPFEAANRRRAERKAKEEAERAKRFGGSTGGNRL